MRKQDGATLAATLLLLLVITLLGITSVQVTHLQEKMSANLQDKELSFVAAESALKAGENWVLSQETEPTVYVTCQAYPCAQQVYENINLATQPSSWWNSRSSQYTLSMDNIATNPRFIIEFLQFVPDSPVVGSSAAKSTGVFYYQVTARGTGATNDSISVLQTTVARRY
ncbi:pilus assembly PilX family protein [Legionella erythra]|uniref:Tfp pilus assembly protein PilX n=1 Tax=Legionella erythra TaxID=448 RepID=A0A0W0TJQ5_LEGER|nr:PilX N-terminal domain-containing pilus assembly protein [Legionella erythra]KTC95814.1 Tfp pilus assembly protein PilX [Legionella erythra]